MPLRPFRQPQDPDTLSTAMEPVLKARQQQQAAEQQATAEENSRRMAEYAPESRPTYIDPVTKLVTPKQDDATWQASQQEKNDTEEAKALAKIERQEQIERNAANEAKWRAENRPMFVNDKHDIVPIHDDATWEAVKKSKSASATLKALKAAEKSRKDALRPELQTLALDIHRNPARQPLGVSQRKDIDGKIQSTIEAAKNALTAHYDQQAKAVDVGSTWNPFDNQPAAGTDQAQAKLDQIAQTYTDPTKGLSDEHLADLQSIAPDLATQLHGYKTALADDDAKVQWQKDAKQRLYDLSLKEQNPTAYLQHKLEQLQGLDDTQATEHLEALRTDLLAEREQLDTQHQTIEQTLAGFDQAHTALAAANDQARQHGIPAGQTVTLPDGTVWHATLYAQAQRAALEQQKWQADTAPDIEALTHRQQDWQQRAQLLDAAEKSRHQQQVQQRQDHIEKIRQEDPETAGLIDEHDQRAADIAKRYAPDSPEFAAAEKALTDDLTQRQTALTQKRQSKAEAGEKLYASLKDISSQWDWTNPPEADKELTGKLIREQGRKLGLSPKETTDALALHKAADWTVPHDATWLEKSGLGIPNPMALLPFLRGDTEHAKKTAVLTPTLDDLTLHFFRKEDVAPEQFRVLPNGVLSINPVLTFQPSAYQKAVESSNATPEAKQAALERRDAMAQESAKASLPILSTTPEFAQFQKRADIKALTPEAQAARFLEEVQEKPKAWSSKLWDQMRLATGNALLGIAQTVTGAITLATGNDTARDITLDLDQRRQDRAARTAVTGSSSDRYLRTAGSLVDNALQMLPTLGVGALAGKLVSYGSKLATAARASTGLADFAETLGHLTRLESKGVSFASPQAMSAAIKSGSGIGEGLQAATQMYPAAFNAYKKQYLADGMDEDKSTEAAHRSAMLPSLLSLATTAVIGYVGGNSGAEALLNKATMAEAKKGFLNFVTHHLPREMKKEAVEEFWQTTADELTAQATYDPDRKVGDMVGSVIEGAFQGALLGGGFTTVGAIAAQFGKASPRTQPTAAESRLEPHQLPETIAAAKAAIASFAPEGYTPEQHAEMQQRAQLVLGIAHGEMPKTEQDWNKLGYTLKDGKPEPLKDYTGPKVLDFADKEHQQPVILQSYIDSMDKALPAVADAIGMDEADVREFYQTSPSNVAENVQTATTTAPSPTKAATDSTAPNVAANVQNDDQIDLSPGPLKPAPANDEKDDASIANESDASLQARTTPGPQREAAHKARREAAVRLAATLRPGDRLVSESGDDDMVVDGTPTKGGSHVSIHGYDEPIDVASELTASTARDAHGNPIHIPARTIVRAKPSPKTASPTEPATAARGSVAQAATTAKNNKDVNDRLKKTIAQMEGGPTAQDVAGSTPATGASFQEKIDDHWNKPATKEDSFQLAVDAPEGEWVEDGTGGRARKTTRKKTQLGRDQIEFESQLWNDETQEWEDNPGGYSSITRRPDGTITGDLPEAWKPGGYTDLTTGERIQTKPVHQVPGVAGSTPATGASVETDLFGNPTEPATAARGSVAQAATAATPPSAVDNAENGAEARSASAPFAHLGTDRAVKRATELSNYLHRDLRLADEGMAQRIAAALVRRHGTEDHTYMGHVASKHWKQDLKALGLTGSLKPTKALEGEGLQAPEDFEARLKSYEMRTDTELEALGLGSGFRAMLNPTAEQQALEARKRKVAAMRASQSEASQPSASPPVATVSPSPASKSPSLPTTPTLASIPGYTEQAADLLSKATLTGRKRLRTTLKALESTLQTFGKAFSKIQLVTNASPATKSNLPSGNMMRVEADDSLTINLPALASQLDYLARSTRSVEAIASEEFIHRVAMSLAAQDSRFSFKGLVAFWNRLPAKLQQTVWQAYHNNALKDNPLGPLSKPSALTDEGKFHMAHEFIRMLVQDKAFAGRITETVDNPGLLQWIRDLLSTVAKRLRSFLGKAPKDVQAQAAHYEAQVIAALDRFRGAYTAATSTPASNQQHTAEAIKALQTIAPAAPATNPPASVGIPPPEVSMDTSPAAASAAAILDAHNKAAQTNSGLPGYELLTQHLAIQASIAQAQHRRSEAELRAALSAGRITTDDYWDIQELLRIAQGAYELGGPTGPDGELIAPPFRLGIGQRQSLQRLGIDVLSTRLGQTGDGRFIHNPYTLATTSGATPRVYVERRHLIISQGTIDHLAKRLPHTAQLIGLSEAQARAQFGLPAKPAPQYRADIEQQAIADAAPPVDPTEPKPEDTTPNVRPAGKVSAGTGKPEDIAIHISDLVSKQSAANMKKAGADHDKRDELTLLTDQVRRQQGLETKQQAWDYIEAWAQPLQDVLIQQQQRQRTDNDKLDADKRTNLDDEGLLARYWKENGMDEVEALTHSVRYMDLRRQLTLARTQDYIKNNPTSVKPAPKPPSERVAQKLAKLAAQFKRRWQKQRAADAKTEDRLAREADRELDRLPSFFSVLRSLPGPDGSMDRDNLLLTLVRAPIGIPPRSQRAGKGEWNWTLTSPLFEGQTRRFKTNVYKQEGDIKSLNWWNQTLFKVRDTSEGGDLSERLGELKDLGYFPGIARDHLTSPDGGNYLDAAIQEALEQYQRRIDGDPVTAQEIEDERTREDEDRRLNFEEAITTGGSESVRAGLLNEGDVVLFTNPEGEEQDFQVLSVDEGPIEAQDFDAEANPDTQWLKDGQPYGIRAVLVQADHDLYGQQWIDATLLLQIQKRYTAAEAAQLRAEQEAEAAEEVEPLTAADIAEIDHELADQQTPAKPTTPKAAAPKPKPTPQPTAPKPVVTFTTKRASDRPGLFYGTHINAAGSVYHQLPDSGPKVRTIHGTHHDGDAGDAPLADAIDTGKIWIPDWLRDLVAGHNFADPVMDTDLVGLLSLHDQGLEIVHFPDFSDPTKIVSIDLRTFDKAKALAELEADLEPRTTKSANHSIAPRKGSAPTTPTPAAKSKAPKPERDPNIPRKGSQFGATPEQRQLAITTTYGPLAPAVKVRTDAKGMPWIMRGRGLLIDIADQPHVAMPQVALPLVGTGHAPGNRFIPLAGDKSNWVGHINRAINQAFPTLDADTDIYIEPYGGGLVYLQNLDVLQRTTKPILIAVSSEFEPQRLAIYQSIKNGNQTVINDLRQALADPQHIPTTDEARHLISLLFADKERVKNNATAAALTQLPSLITSLQRPNVEIKPYADEATLRTAIEHASQGKRVTLLEDSNYADLPFESTKTVYADGLDSTIGLPGLGPSADEVVSNFIGKDAAALLAQKLPVYRTVLGAGGTIIGTNNMAPGLLNGLLAEFGNQGHWFGYNHQSRLVADSELKHPDGMGVLWRNERPEYLAILRKDAIGNPPKYGFDTPEGLDYRPAQRQSHADLARQARPYSERHPDAGTSTDRDELASGQTSDPGSPADPGHDRPSRNASDTPPAGPLDGNVILASLRPGDRIVDEEGGSIERADQNQGLAASPREAIGGTEEPSNTKVDPEHVAAFRKYWLNKSGTAYLVQDHLEGAQRAKADSPDFDSRKPWSYDDMFVRGWFRIQATGTALYAEGGTGLVPNSRQMRWLNDARIYLSHATGNDIQLNTAKGTSMLQASPREVAPAFYSRLQEAIRSAPFGQTETKHPQQWGGVIQKWAGGRTAAASTLWRAGIAKEELKWSGILPWLAAQNKPLTKAQVLDYLTTEGAVQFTEHRTGDLSDKFTVRMNTRPPFYVMEGTHGWDVHSGRNNDLIITLPTEDEADETVRHMTEGYHRYGNQHRRALETWEVISPRQELVSVHGTEQEAIESAEGNQRGYDDHGGGMQSTTRYAQYQLPGGTNYREVVLAMPVKSQNDPIQSFKRLADGSYDVIFRDGEEGSYDTLEEARADGNGTAEVKGVDEYRSSHFPNVPNYLAHMRLNDRVDAQGHPGTLLEELQSDRHQAARKKGYKREVEEWLAFYTTPNGADVPVGYGSDAASALANADPSWKGLVDIKTRKTGTLTEGQIPDAPHRKDWPLALFKRALRDAVAAGKQWIGWTTGQTQADRYDLSKQVDSVRVRKTGPNHYHIGYSKDGHVHSISDTDLTAEQLPDHIGKDLAQRIISDTFEGDKVKIYKDADLKIGGEGMKGFYDHMLPKQIGNYVKQWGATVEQTSIDASTTASVPSLQPITAPDWEAYQGAEPFPNGDRPLIGQTRISIDGQPANATVIVSSNGLHMIDYEGENEWIAPPQAFPNGLADKWFGTAQEALNSVEISWKNPQSKFWRTLETIIGEGKAAPTHDTTPIWKVTITPQMRASIQATGQPLFASTRDPSSQPPPLAGLLNLRYTDAHGNPITDANALREAHRASDPLQQGGSLRPDAQPRTPTTPAALLPWAKETGWLLNPAALEQRLNEDREIKGGDEHDVWFDEPSQRVLKITLDNQFIAGGPSGYLRNLRQQNQLFDAGYTFEGVVYDNGMHRIVTSQTYVHGSPAPTPAIDAYFDAKGFAKIHDGLYYSSAQDLVVSDARPANVLQEQTTGRIQPIDVQIRTPNASAIQRYEDILNARARGSLAASNRLSIDEKRRITASIYAHNEAKGSGTRISNEYLGGNAWFTPDNRYFHAEQHWFMLPDDADYTQAMQSGFVRLSFESGTDKTLWAEFYPPLSTKKIERLRTEALMKGAELQLDPDRTQTLAASTRSLDALAHQAATSPLNSLPQPTAAQKKAGNYQHGHLRVGPLDITIENPAGSLREGKDPSGKPWATPMLYHYGYVKGSTGKDGDHIDLFLAPGTPPDYNGPVWVINQHHAGQFDEHKALIAASVQNPAQALAAYNAHYTPDWQGAASIGLFHSVSSFHRWATEATHRRAPAAGDLPATIQVTNRLQTAAKTDAAKAALKVSMATTSPRPATTHLLPDEQRVRSLTKPQLLSELALSGTWAKESKDALVGLALRKQGLPFSALTEDEFLASHYFHQTNTDAHRPSLTADQLTHMTGGWVLPGKRRSAMPTAMDGRYGNTVGAQVVAVPLTGLENLNNDRPVRIRAGHSVAPDEVTVLTESSVYPAPNGNYTLADYYHAFTRAEPSPSGTLPSSPRRAYESLTFDPPYQTKFGDIVSYHWMSRAAGGSLVSDWNQAVTNAHTGRPIVHHFKVRKPDGLHTVSLETALGQLSPAQRTHLQAQIKSEQQRRADQANGQLTLFASQRTTAYDRVPGKGDPESLATGYLTGKHSSTIAATAAKRGDIGLLVTPLIPSYLNHADRYPFIAIDNGVFSKATPFSPTGFRSLVSSVSENPELRAKVLFVVAPDVVGDAKATLAQFPEWSQWIRNKRLPVALAAQDGLEHMLDHIPWDRINTLFIGGSTEWKTGDVEDKQAWADLFMEAHRRGIPVHMGRVNTNERIAGVAQLVGASTVDGTYLAYGPDKNLPILERMLDQLNVHGLDLGGQRFPELGRAPSIQELYDLALDPSIVSPDQLGAYEPATKQINAIRTQQGLPSLTGHRDQLELALFASPRPPSPVSESSPLARLGWNHLDRALSDKVADLTANPRASITSTITTWTQSSNLGDLIARAARFVQKELVPNSILPREVTAAMREMNIKSNMAGQEALDLHRALQGKPKFSDIAYPAEFAENPVYRERLFEAMDEHTAGHHAAYAWAKANKPMWDLGLRLRRQLIELGREGVKAGRLNLDTFHGLNPYGEDDIRGYVPRFTKDEVDEQTGSFVKKFRLGVRDLLQQRSTAWHITDTTRTDPRTGEFVTVAHDPNGRQWRFKSAQARDAFYEQFIRQQAAQMLKEQGKEVTTMMTALDGQQRKEVRAEIKAMSLDQIDRPAELSSALAGLAKRAIALQRQRFAKENPYEPAALVKDAVYSIARYTAQMAHDNATAQFLNTVAGNPAWATDAQTTGYTQIPDHPRFGRLAGKFVLTDIANQITELVNQPSDALRVYDTFMGWWKSGKTVLNPGTHVRNVLGNLYFSHLAGSSVWNPGNLKYYQQAIKALAHGGPTLTDAYKAGVLGADFVGTELRQTLRSLVPTEALKPEDILSIGTRLAQLLPHWAKRPLQTGYDKVATLYQVEDEVFKLAAWLKAQAMGMDPAAAAEHVRKWFPFFDGATSSTLRGLGRTVMPFLGFYRESARIFANALRERPIALAAGLALPSLLTAISASLFLSLDDDELTQVQRDMRGKGGKLLGPTPLAARPLFSILLPTKTSNGDLQQFDLSSIHPFADFLGTRVESNDAHDWWQDTWRSLIAAGPLGNLAYSQATGRDAFGDRPFVESNMEPSEKARARLDNAAKIILPPLAPGGTGYQTLANAGTRSTDKSYTFRTPAQAVERAVLGLDVRNAQPDIYRIADDWRQAHGLPVQAALDYRGTTPAGRVRKAIFTELAQPTPDLQRLKTGLQRLADLGHPIRSQNDIDALLSHKNPLSIIDGKERQQQFRASLTGQDRATLERAIQAYQHIKAKAPALLAQARVE